MPATADPQRTRLARGLALGALGSICLHALGYAVLHVAGTLPSVDFEVQLPDQVAFGLAEPPTAPPPPAVEPEPIATAPAQPAAVSDAPAAEPPKPRRKKPKPTDAGVVDAGPKAEDAGPVKEHKDGGQARDVPAEPLLAAYAPAGAQIALRLHMGRIRDSELAPDVRLLLDAVPDWRFVMDGSGLDPLRDIERLYIATPDLRRASLVIAGQYVGGDEVPERAVANLAIARKVRARWRTRGAIRTAPWANADETARVIALIAPGQFTIVRPDDLPRVLDVARALARRGDEQSAATDAEAADALLGLSANETLALSIEGARLFTRGNMRGIPERLTASVQLVADGMINTLIIGTFESPEAAEQARAYWEQMRERYAGNPLVALIGMREPLNDAEVTAHETQLEIRTHVTVQQARVVLGFITSAIGQPAAAGLPDRARDRSESPPVGKPALKRSAPKGRVPTSPSSP